MVKRLKIYESVNNSYFKNVDICDLPSIMKKGILSLNASDNDNWVSGHRAKNSRDVVYLFRPTGYENSFVQYGVALLEIIVDGKRNEMVANDVNKGKYIEYVCDYVPPENIIAVYIPKIFKDRVSFRHSKLHWVDMEAKIFDDNLFKQNKLKYGTIDKFGLVTYNNDYNSSLNYSDCTNELLRQFAKTAPIDDSSEFNYFRGKTAKQEIIDLNYIHYDID